MAQVFYKVYNIKVWPALIVTYLQNCISYDIIDYTQFYCN